MNDARISAFWNSYFKLDELKKRALLLQLTGINKLNVTLMQSYFDDLEQKARADERERVLNWIKEERLYQKEQNDKYHKAYWLALDKIEALAHPENPTDSQSPQSSRIAEGEKG